MTDKRVQFWQFLWDDFVRRQNKLKGKRASLADVSATAGACVSA